MSKEKEARSLIDLVPRKFFAPLSAPNNKLLFECADMLIGGSESFNILYEKNARKMLKEYLKERYDDISDEDDGEGFSLGKGAAPEEMATRILFRFRDCGWVTKDKLAPNGEMLASVTPQCRAMVRAFKTAYRENIETDIRNAVSSMYDILKGAVKDGNRNRTEYPYSGVLEPLSKEKDELEELLTSLDEEIEAIKAKANAITSISDISDLFCRDEYRKKFFSDYEKLSQHGLITSSFSSIRDMLETFKERPLYRQAVKEYEQTKETDPKKAERDVYDIYFDLKEFTGTGYDDAIRRINAKINESYDLYNRKICMLIKEQDRDLKKINDIYDTVIRMDPKKAKGLLDVLRNNTMNIYRAEIVDFDSVKRKNHHAHDHNVHPLIDVIPEDIRKSENEKMLSSFREPYDLNSVKKYFDAVIPDSGELKTEDMSIKDENDVLMLISVMLYAGTDDFGYTVEKHEGETDKGKVKIQNITIRRKEKERKNGKQQ